MIQWLGAVPVPAPVCSSSQVRILPRVWTDRVPPTQSHQQPEYWTPAFLAPQVTISCWNFESSSAHTVSIIASYLVWTSTLGSFHLLLNPYVFQSGIVGSGFQPGLFHFRETNLVTLASWQVWAIDKKGKSVIRPVSSRWGNSVAAADYWVFGLAACFRARYYHNLASLFASFFPWVTVIGRHSLSLPLKRIKTHVYKCFFPNI